jgi:hypothetical protein
VGGDCSSVPLCASRTAQLRERMYLVPSSASQSTQLRVLQWLAVDQVREARYCVVDWLLNIQLSVESVASCRSIYWNR